MNDAPPQRARQRRLTIDALAALAHTDFALAGSGAIREHGLQDRPTQDVDLFTATVDPNQFREALQSLTRSLVELGYAVEVLRQAPAFARLQVTAADGHDLELDLGTDWRAADPTRTPVGPVLSIEDAVGSKVDALYGRAETRDYLDVDAIRQSGRFSDDELLDIVAARDPGFDRTLFAEQLERVQQLTAGEVGRYGVSQDQLAQVQERLRSWGQLIRSAEGSAP